MAAPLIPWEPCNIPAEVQSELNRRKKNVGMNFIDAEKGQWNEETGEWAKYYGPMASWTRLCSNGYGDENLNRPGFVFFSGQDFYSGYGFKQNSGGVNESIIGYMPDGNPHTIEYDRRNTDSQIHVAPPAIKNVTAVIQKELFRRVTIEWICFSPKQLEYMTPYFLTAGISCVVEWGWNHFEPSCLLDLNNTTKMVEFMKNPYPLYTEHILKSRGNYDVLIGTITNFNWKLEGDKIICTTEVTSKDRLYAGIPIDSTTVADSKTGGQDTVEPLGTLKNFFDIAATQFKSIQKYEGGVSNPDPLDGVRGFADYLKRKSNYKEILYGVYYGRDIQDKKTPREEGDNLKDDWDGQPGHGHLWLNFGLVVEIVNYHTKDLLGPDGNPFFEIDIDDVVISGHPNLISTDGNVLLIPNAKAPKYHLGWRGDRKDYKDPEKPEYPLAASTYPSQLDKRKPSDVRLSKLCAQLGEVHRDNLSVVINELRKRLAGEGKYEFPFAIDTLPEGGVQTDKAYPALYSGYLKNLYVHINVLKSAAAGEKTIRAFFLKVLQEMSSAAGNHWDFHFAETTGKVNNNRATMKIVDGTFATTVNSGDVFSFDYANADDVLLGVSFNPMLSDAVAVRTIFANNSYPERKTALTMDAQLLEGKFRDRLFLDAARKNGATPPPNTSRAWKELIRSLQCVKPPQTAFQVTTKKDEKWVTVKRLVLPDVSILQLLLDDGDVDTNPKYTGIMPGIQAQFTIQGIGGLRTFMMFLVRNLPDPYSEKNIIFRIVDLQETISGGKWVTVITAGIIPLRKHIKERLRIK